MERYVALLRGVNIGGRNKVPMAEWKQCMESAGFSDVKTYLNSGNAIFTSEKDDPMALATQIEELIRNHFGISVPVFVIAQNVLAELLHRAPDWWGDANKEIYDNLIFMLPPVTFAQVFEEIGAPKEGLEQIQPDEAAIFWSFSRKNYQKTNWWPKTASARIGQSLTIRTANTVKKLAQM